MRVFFVTSLMCLPITGHAETISTEIGQSGLKVTEARLAALPNPTNADNFALGGVRFLATLEHALQVRWASGISDSTGMLPFLRVPIGENPNPAAFDPAAIAGLFRDISTQLDAARAPLAKIPPTADFGVEIAFRDIWFDINANATRDIGENMIEVLGPTIMGWQWDNRDPATPAPVVRFDAADAVWLSAYTHLLGGFCDTLLAYDPTTAITKIASAKTAMAALDPSYNGANAEFDIASAVDLIATIADALNQSPDTARLTSAHTHFLAMVADNRSFWDRVERETDNNREWLPNDRQKSALGIELPPGTGKQWLAVLSDAEAVLNGTQLVPYWRIGPAGGVNLGRMFTDPAPIDLVGWIQGWGALPYLEHGPSMSTQNWTTFEAMLSGESMLFSLYLN